MEPDSKLPPAANGPQNAPPPVLASEPPLIGTPPPISPGGAQRAETRGKDFLAMVLSLCLGLFLADGFISLMDDCLAAVSGHHFLSVFRGLIGLASFCVTTAVYLLIGFFPAIPRRYFLPLTLYDLTAGLALLFLMIYFYPQLQRIVLVFSLCQVLFGLGILYLLRGGLNLKWPLVPLEKLNPRPFSWTHLCVFVLVNVFVLLPAAFIYLGVCASLALTHFSEGFMALGTDGISVVAKTYVRGDGKSIQLFPMAHVGEADFYENISRAFPTNGVILMEGVTDTDHLLTNKLSYKKMAKTLGLSEQKETFAPKRGEAVRADVDINQFSKTTIDFLNFATLFHSTGVNPETISTMMSYAPEPGLEKILIDDLLVKRNQHLLEEIKSHLRESDKLIVPWGAAHMPGIAKALQSEGFHPVDEKRYVVIRFGSHGDKRKTAGKNDGESGGK